MTVACQTAMLDVAMACPGDLAAASHRMRKAYLVSLSDTRAELSTAVPTFARGVLNDAFTAVTEPAARTLKREAGLRLPAGADAVTLTFGLSSLPCVTGRQMEAALRCRLPDLFAAAGVGQPMEGAFRASMDSLAYDVHAGDSVPTAVFISAVFPAVAALASLRAPLEAASEAARLAAAAAPPPLPSRYTLPQPYG